DDSRKRYINSSMLLNAPLDVRTDPTFRVRIRAGSEIQMIDFIRDLIIRHEEDRGTVVLHASGVCRDDDAVVIAGPKGAGKTTTLLSVLRHPEWSYFTGDKAFCELAGDHLVVYPWRDYPYVGVGTIRADQRLERLVREATGAALDQYPPSHKVLLDPDVFEAWLGAEFSPRPRRLAAVMLPEVRPDEPLTTWRLSSDAERWAHLNKIVDRQVDTTFFTWQSYLVPDYSAFYRSLSQLRQVLPSIDMVRLRGTLDIDLGAVLGRDSAARPLCWEGAA
ncbi:MAG TPA: hypothetical protein VGS19_39045, partial [Streptosporangiaceae bacterium]|nr:hypothetical protein [Streptosporangiaceae bacterium]